MQLLWRARIRAHLPATGFTIVGATSGDTGSSAEYAARPTRPLRRHAHPRRPHDRLPRAQMLSSSNIANVADGVFDDRQDPSRPVNMDADWAPPGTCGLTLSTGAYLPRLPLPLRHQRSKVSCCRRPRVISATCRSLRLPDGSAAGHPVKCHQ